MCYAMQYLCRAVGCLTVLHTGYHRCSEAKEKKLKFGKCSQGYQPDRYGRSSYACQYHSEVFRP